MTDFKQDAPMDIYPVRMTAAHARKARKLGDGNLSGGVRLAIEETDNAEVPAVSKGTEDRRK